MAGNQEVLTLQQKQRLCQEKEKDMKLTQPKLLAMATQLWGIKPSINQIQRMLREKDDFLQVRPKLPEDLLHPVSDELKEWKVLNAFYKRSLPLSRMRNGGIPPSLMQGLNCLKTYSTR